MGGYIMTQHQNVNYEKEFEEYLNREKHLALMVLNRAKNNNSSFSSREDLVKHPEVIKFYRERIDYLTRDLGQVEKIKKFTLLPHEFTQESGEMTPTQKIRRKVINEHYKDIIEAMYAE